MSKMRNEMCKFSDPLFILEELPLDRLREKWVEHYNSPFPRNMSAQLLRVAIGYKLQEVKHGGLSRSARLRLKSLISASSRPASEPYIPAVPKSGARFFREWQGRAHEVLALDGGSFAYSGKVYRSLTTIALQITGTHQSGPRFFGLSQNKGTAHGRAS